MDRWHTLTRHPASEHHGLVVRGLAAADWLGQRDRRPVSRWVAPQRGCCSVPRHPEEREQPGGAGGGAPQGAAPAVHPDRVLSSPGVVAESLSPLQRTKDHAVLQALSAAGWAGGCGAGQAGPGGRSDAPECGAAMPWFPVKKVRKQMKLLLLLLLLTCAAWLTYVHRSLVRPGRALRQRLGYGRGTRWRAARGPGPPEARGSDCPEPLFP